MTDQHPDKPSEFNPQVFLKREWPYLAILILAVFGVAYTSVAQQPITTYWMGVAPLVGVICVVTGWRAAQTSETHWRLVWTQALHWGGVLAAMNLTFVADVRHMLNADGQALSVLTLLALGTFTAGVHAPSWRISLVGIVLGCGVPAIAWLEQSVLLLLLAVAAVVGVTAPLWWHGTRETANAASP